MEYKPSFSDDLRTDIQPSYKDSLMHHGIKGMKWGIRRYQNSDGTLADAGKKRYFKLADKGDKLRAEGYDLYSNKTALTKKEKIGFAVGTGAATAASIMTGNPIPLVVAASSILVKDANNRKAIIESINRESDVKMKDIKKQNNNASNSQNKLNKAMQEVFGDGKKIDYMNIYKEMSKEKNFKNLLDSDDPNDYRMAEKAWLKKHGY